MTRPKRVFTRLLPLIFIVLTASCVTTTPEKKVTDAQEADLHLRIGINYLVKGNVEMADFELSKAARLNPHNAEVHFALGTVNIAKKEYDKAIVQFDRTIAIDKSYADAYNNMGFAYLKLEQWDKAIQACNKALKSIGYQTPEKALTIIGEAYYRKGDTGKATEYLQRALTINPKEPQSANTMARIYIEDGKVDKAKGILLKVIANHPGYANARLNMGIAYYKERDFRAAKKEFNKVLDLVDGKSADGQLARGYLDLIQ